MLIWQMLFAAFRPQEIRKVTASERSPGICGAPRLLLKGLGFVGSHSDLSP
jgi:hypothetical protein